MEPVILNLLETLLLKMVQCVERNSTKTREGQ